MLGLKLTDRRKVVDTETSEKLVELLLEMRQKAKANKDFATADTIRKSLTDIGISVMDTPSGANWEAG